MEQSTNDAVVKDAQVKLGEEGCALSTEQRLNDAALSDAKIMLRREECA